jgi:hypothetical protein
MWFFHWGFRPINHLQLPSMNSIKLSHETCKAQTPFPTNYFKQSLLSLSLDFPSRSTILA